MRREQFQRYKQYLQSLYRHGSINKLINLLKVEFRLFNNNPDMQNLFPYFLVIDISNSCNLSCPLCQMGLRQHIPRKNLMTLQNYIKLIDPLKKYLFQIFLFNWSEPFLNKEIYDIIDFNTRNNIATSISTNFNVQIEPEKLMNSGLEHLIISADGITQDVYEKYRRGGKLEKVFSNLKLLVDTKRKTGSLYPYIEWQCLVTKYNENQLSRIKQTALSKGANEVRFANLNFYSVKNNILLQKEWLPKNPVYNKLVHNKNSSKRKHRLRKPCFWLWRTAIVNSDGGITPCCLYDIPNWGNVHDNDFSSIWNNSLFREARQRSKNDRTLHTSIFHGLFLNQAKKIIFCIFYFTIL